MSLSPSRTSCYTPTPSVLAREVGGEMVLLDPHRGVYYGLNEVGHRIWTLLSEGRSVAEIEGRLLAEYDAPSAAIQEDLQTLLRELCDHGLIEKVAD